MKPITFNTRSHRLGELTETSGYALDVHVPTLRLAVHKHIPDVTAPGKFQWIVTELKSGFIFLEGRIGESRKSCIERVYQRIKEYGIAEINRRIQAVVEQYSYKGLAN